MMALAWTEWPASLPPDSPHSAPGSPVASEDAARIWRELASGEWEILSAVDANGLRHVAMAPRSAKPHVDWRTLRARERNVLALVAQGFPQKVIAMKLGMSASSVSSAFRSARDRLGFGSSNQMVCAYHGAHEGLSDPLGTVEEPLASSTFLIDAEAEDE